MAWSSPYQSIYQSIANQAALANGIDPTIFSNLIASESSWNPSAIGPSFQQNGQTINAQGIAQFLPSTAANLGINPLDPIQALNGSAQYLNTLVNQYNGNMNQAVAAYKGFSNVNSPAAQAAASNVTGIGAGAITDPSQVVGEMQGTVPSNGGSLTDNATQALGLSFKDLFTKPLDALKSFGGSLLLGFFGILVLVLTVMAIYKKASK